MSLVSQNIPGLYNGVSQQAPSVRLPSQCEMQLNILSSITDGIERRPPTEWVAKLTGSWANQNSYYYLYERAPGLTYLVIITSGSGEPIEIYWCETGQKCTVQYGYFDKEWRWTATTAAMAYVSNVSYPEAYFRCLGIADHVLVLNRAVVAHINTAYQLETPYYEYIIWIKQVQPKLTWYVQDGINGSINQAPVGVSADGMMTWEMAGIFANYFRNRGYEVFQNDSVLKVRRRDKQAFFLNILDAWGGRNVSIIAGGQTQKFSDLPPYCFGGTRVKITQDDASEFDSYYVEFVETGASKGYWQESRGWYLYNQLDEWTMPHRLVRLSDTSFAFCPCIWEERKIGDEISAPYPSFNWKGIWNMFLWRGRLGFLSGENVILSRVSDFFNLWPKTALDVLDDDPIDVAAVSQQSVNLRSARPFEKQLVLIADNEQFVAGASQTLTPTSLVIDTVTNIPADTYTEPVGSGSNLYFLSPTNAWNRMREYLVQPETMTTDAADITAHVPRYLPGGRGTLSAAPSLDLLAFHSYLVDPYSVFIYRFYWRGTEKLMSSWSKWTFGARPLFFKIAGSTAWIVTSASGEVHLEKLNLENIPVQGGAGAWGSVHLDRRIWLAGTYDPINGWTNFNLPYSDPALNFMVIGPDGLPRTCTKTANNQVRVTGNLSGAFVGKTYISWYRPSELYLRGDKDDSIVDGNLVIRTLGLNLVDTGYLRVGITPPGRPQQLIEVHTDYLNRYTGFRRVPVMSGNRGLVLDIVGDTYAPFKIHSGVIEGFYTRRNRPL